MNASAAKVWRLNATRVWTLDEPRVLGIVNVTPDSFSDGGAYARIDDVLRASESMLKLGANGLDIGGESTRPGAARVDAREQIRRVEPVIVALRRTLGDAFAITIDTTRSEVARIALDAGADAINDVSAGEDDPHMFALAAERSCGLILMHRRLPPAHDSYSTRYSTPPDFEGGVVDNVTAYLWKKSQNAVATGVPVEGILADPGLGFGKSVDQNLLLLTEGTRALVQRGLPVLSGVSRKSFTARAAGLPDDTPPKERVSASVGLSVAHWFSGARVFRVHDVGEHVQALKAAASAGKAGSVDPQNPARTEK